METTYCRFTSTVDCMPEPRRRFLDWGVFHVEARFVDDWLARGASLAEALPQSWTHVQEGGVTQFDPHRAELYIRLDDMAVKDRGD